MVEFYDIVATILTFMTFGVMFFGLAIVVLIKNIEKDWPKYKCNPAIMPFVGFVGKDAASNFNECVGNIQGQYMSYFLGPITKTLGTMTSVGNGLLGSISDITATVSSVTGGLFDILATIDNIIKGIIREFQILLLKFTNIIYKIGGIFIVFYNVIKGMSIFVTSIVEGPIGRMVEMIETIS